MVYLDVVSGFLGAGKTTFINRLLDFYVRMGEKPAYVVNEYGEAALDAQLMREEGFASAEIIGGCICCTLRGKVTESIAQIIDEYHPTRIVFEPSGVFRFDNFFDILDTRLLAGKCEVGNIITVIDVVNYKPARLEFGNFIYNQIESAPVLFLSKLDKGEPDITEVLCDVRNINPHAVIITKTYDELTDDYMKAVLLDKQEACEVCGDVHDHDHPGHGEGCGCGHHHEEHEHGEDCGCGHRHEHHEHDHHALSHETFETMTIPAKKEFSEDEIQRLTEDVINGGFGDIVRAKGIVEIGGKPHLVNVAFGQREIKIYPNSGEPSMTFIGRKLEREKLAQWFGQEK